MAATRYTLLIDGLDPETFSRKERAVQHGDAQDQPYSVVTDSGRVVAERGNADGSVSVESVPAEAETVTEPPAADEAEDLLGTVEAEPSKARAAKKASKTAAKAETEDPFAGLSVATVSYRDHGPKSFWQALGVSAADSLAASKRFKGQVTIKPVGRDHEILVGAKDGRTTAEFVEALSAVYDEVMTSFPAWKKAESNTEYKACDKRTREGMNAAYGLEKVYMTTTAQKLVRKVTK